MTNKNKATLSKVKVSKADKKKMYVRISALILAIVLLLGIIGPSLISSI